MPISAHPALIAMTVTKMTIDVIALARQHLPYDWAPALIAAAEAGDKKALRKLRKWLRLADVIVGPSRQPRTEPDDASGYAEPCQSGWYED